MYKQYVVGEAAADAVLFVFYKNRKNSTTDPGALYFMKTGSIKPQKLSLTDITAVNTGAVHGAFSVDLHPDVDCKLLVSIHSKQGPASDLCLESKDEKTLAVFVEGLTGLLAQFALDYEGNANPNQAAKAEQKQSREETVLQCSQALSSVKKDMRGLKQDCQELMQFVTMDLKPLIDGVSTRVQALTARLAQVCVCVPCSCV